MKEKKEKTKRKRSTFSSIIRSLIVTLLLGGILFGGLSVVYSFANKDGMSLTDAIISAVSTPKSKILEQKYVTVLLCGVNQKLTDSIMVARYNTENKKISIFSIPRDTYVGRGLDKRINSLYAWKGIEELKKEVQDITNVTIDRHAIINTKALRDVVDAVGGVEVDVPKKMDYDDPAQDLHIHLKAGVQTLNGVQAEGFVRMRKCFADQDLSRVKNQRAFLQALAKKVMQPNNLLKVNEILDIGMRNTETDLTIREMLDLFASAKDINFDQIYSDTLPTKAQRVSGREYEVEDKTKSKAVIQKTLIDSLKNDIAGEQDK